MLDKIQTYISNCKNLKPRLGSLFLNPTYNKDHEAYVMKPEFLLGSTLIRRITSITLITGHICNLIILLDNWVKCRVWYFNTVLLDKIVGARLVVLASGQAQVKFTRNKFS